MEEIRNLFREFSGIKGFDGWMIGKLYFYRKEKLEVYLEEDGEKTEYEQERKNTQEMGFIQKTGQNERTVEGKSVQPCLCQRQVQTRSSIWHDTKHEKRSMMSAAIIKRKKNFAVLEVSGEENCIQMVVLKPQVIPEVEYSDTMWKQIENRNCGDLCKKTNNQEREFSLPKGCVAIASRIFSREEVKAFVKEVQDDNWIHQTERPVVPGLMMAEWLWKMGEVSLVDKIMIFRSPVYAQEKIVVYQEPCSQRYFAVTEEQGTMAGTDVHEKGKRLLWEVKNQNKKNERYSLCK